MERRNIARAAEKLSHMLTFKSYKDCRERHKVEYCTQCKLHNTENCIYER